MQASLFVFALLAQGQPAAEVTASVDRTRLALGEEVMLTVRTRTRSAEPIQVILPPLSGFVIVGSRDFTEVSIGAPGPGGGAVRTTVRELQLRAEQVGPLTIGSVRARQGRRVVATEPIRITVDTASSRMATALSPIARTLLERAPPPPPLSPPLSPPSATERADGVALTVLVPADTVRVGEQIDVIAAAWVPRELRERMRRLPVLTLRTPEGVWAYPATTPQGIAAARVVGGRWMDLFITHQIVFPLSPGSLIVPPAAVEYALPVTFSFFSREERYSLRSDSVRITVLPLPAGGADDRGVVGTGLTLDFNVEPAATRAGEPIEAAATVSGIGNVALWPEPLIRWPKGFRSYPAETEVRLEPRAGRIAGSKTFRFLAVPDSAGNFVIPELRYPYFAIDPSGGGRYALAVAAPRALTVAPGAERRAARALPPLVGPLGEAPLDRLGRRAGVEGALALLLLPPLVTWAVARRRRARRQPPAEAGDRGGGREGGARVAGPRSRLAALEREFHGVLASHVPDSAARDGDGLAQALRAAGIDGAVADHVQRLRDRLRAARYGPRGAGDAVELAAELEQVLRVLGGGSERSASPRRRLIASLALLVLSAAALSAQTAGVGAAGAGAGAGAGAEALYRAGALRAAVDSFAGRAARQPREAAHWYNLGATLYRAGADGKATAAWTRAARLVPRERAVRTARDLLPAPDAASEGLLRVSWATPAEWAAVAVVAWVSFWLLALAWPRGRPALALLGALSLGTGVAGAVEWRRRARPVVVVVADTSAVRAAPYGGASAMRTMRAGSALLAGRGYGAWREVRRRDGIRGWMLAIDLAEL